MLLLIQLAKLHASLNAFYKFLAGKFTGEFVIKTDNQVVNLFYNGKQIQMKTTFIQGILSVLINKT